MFDGKEKRLALIDELLIVASTQKINENEERLLVEKQREKAAKAAIIEGLHGKLLSETLAELSQKALKEKDLDALTQFMSAAEKERKRRENQETGSRQAEIVLKKREEQLHDEVMRVHQNTVGKSFCLLELSSYYGRTFGSTLPMSIYFILFLSFSLLIIVIQYILPDIS